MGHIQRRHLSEAKVKIPPKDVIERLGGIFEPLIERTLSCKRELKLLNETRDALLPKLLSGEMTVSVSSKDSA